MNRIIKKKSLAPGVKLMEVENPLIARKFKPGQFVMLRLYEKGERIPLTLSDYDRERGTITFVFHEVGKTTTLLGRLNEGEEILNLVGPLGIPTDFSNLRKVLMVSGGLGAALVYPHAKEMKRRNIVADLILGARTKEMVILEKEIKPYCRETYIVTEDGSKGEKGVVTDVLRRLLEKGARYDQVFVVGPLPMAKAVCALTKEYNLSTLVSMDPIMVCGTGMCGACRLRVGNEIKLACVDGPEFDGHLVAFDEVIKRKMMYREEERRAMELLLQETKEDC